ncbi:MAG: DNA topoisomerase [Bryobacterales bacterium]|nr:DNA topoisomerase [Bryobacterales bacterium]
MSYPRTDSRHLSQSVAETLPKVVVAIGPRYAGLVAEGSGKRPLGKRYVDDTKITDHHAIIPTATSAERLTLSEDERRIYDLVCRRLLSAWHDDYLTDVTTVITLIENPGVEDLYHSSGTAVRQMGWKVLDIVTRGAAGKSAKTRKAGKGEKAESAESDIPDVDQGRARRCCRGSIAGKRRRSWTPKRSARRPVPRNASPKPPC